MTSSTPAHLLHRGSELLRDGDAERAREHLERALAVLPGHAVARNLLGRSLFHLGHIERALVIIYESLELDYPRSLGAKVNLALALLKLGRAAAARPIFERVVAQAPEHRRAWGYLGVTLEQLGLLDEAERALLAGHYATAARRMRERSARPVPCLEVTPESAKSAMPAGLPRRRTLPPDAPAPASGAMPALGVAGLPRFSVTLRPPQIVDGPGTRVAPVDEIEEIPLEASVLPPPNRPALPLLDAALASLVAAPHGATVAIHATGLLMVALVENETTEGGFAARADTIQVTTGTLRREGLEPAFPRLTGTGQIVLRPSAGARLWPLDMDAEVAFLREDAVVGFDHALLFDRGRLRRPAGPPLPLVRLRGDGVVVIELAQPLYAIDVQGEQAVTARTDTLLGWVGLLAPEAGADPEDELLTFRGEGTVLLRAPREETR